MLGVNHKISNKKHVNLQDQRLQFRQESTVESQTKKFPLLVIKLQNTILGEFAGKQSAVQLGQRAPLPADILGTPFPLSTARPYLDLWLSDIANPLAAGFPRFKATWVYTDLTSNCGFPKIESSNYKQKNLKRLSYTESWYRIIYYTECYKRTNFRISVIGYQGWLVEASVSLEEIEVYVVLDYNNNITSGICFNVYILLGLGQD